MKRSYEKYVQPVHSTKPTTLNLQTRGFAPPQPELIEDISSQYNRSASSENLLEKLISTSSAALSNVPIQRKTQNRLKAIQSSRMVIQAKLNIGEPNDKYEKEADATATKVVQQINSSPQNRSVQRNESMESEDKELQMKPAISTIQRDESIEEEDEELQMKSLVQRRENIGEGEASTDLESSIQSARGSGQSLDANLQAKMGEAMGADFSGVKVHTDSQSDQLNKSIQAKAFTTGKDVFFRQGEYNPESRQGQELLAHELTHVVQQRSAGVGLVQRKEGDIVKGVVQKKPTDQSGKLYVKTAAVMPWYNLPEGSDVKEGDQVEFTEGANRAVTELNVTKEMRVDIDTSIMNPTQLFNAFYGLMQTNAPAILVEKYQCSGEDGTKKYSKEYKVAQIPEDIILHIHWERTGKKIDVAKAHIKRKENKYSIGKSASLTISELTALKIPISGDERLFNKLI